MSQIYPLVPLNYVLKYRKEFIDIDDIETYKRCRVQLHAQGIILRDIVKGAEIKTKKQQVCRKGEFLVAEIDAKIGGFGIVPENLDGAIVSSHYFLFEINEFLINKHFLNFYIRTPAFRDQIAAQGSTNYAAIRPNDVLGYTIPLPPLLEQRRIVARVEELVGKVEEVRSLRQQLLDTRLPYLREALFYQVFQGKILPHHQDVEPASKLLGKINALKERLIVEKKIPNKNKIPPILPSEKPYEIPSSWEWVRLDDICLLITDGTHQTPRYVEKGMMFLSAQNIKPYRFIPQNHKCVSYEDYLSYIANKKAEKGDILLTRVGAGIGEAAMVNQDLDFAFYVSIGLLKPVQDYVYSPYIVHWLNSPDGVASSRKNTLGKGHSQGNLNLNLIRKFVLPLPPLPEQRRIVAYLDELQTKVDTMKRLREEAMKELNALLPSILDKAFKGEL